MQQAIFGLEIFQQIKIKNVRFTVSQLLYISIFSVRMGVLLIFLAALKTPYM